jgi:hypothetical protein
MGGWRGDVGTPEEGMDELEERVNSRQYYLIPKTQ